MIGFCTSRTLLTRDHRLAQNIVYNSKSQPDPPSALRQLVYQENADVLIGPTGDRAGWHDLNPLFVSGVLFGTREVRVKCTVSAPCCSILIGADMFMSIAFSR
jgi:hypothetical protein